MSAANKATLVLLKGNDCPLCTTMQDELKAVQASLGFALYELNISEHPELQEPYRLRIPYLFVEGRPFAKGSLDPAKLKRRLFWNRIGFQKGPLPAPVNTALSRAFESFNTEDSTKSD